MRRRRGFTLIELLIVLVIIAIIITISLPSLLGTKSDANEGAALATVRQIVQAQMAFSNRKEADLNFNSQGEYGSFGEMSGNVPVRAGNGGTKFLEPSVINPSFRQISPIGEMFRAGYYYRVYLPDANGQGVLELPGGGADPSVDADMAEVMWCVYAWPQKFGTTGRRAYFANQSGDITFTEDPSYTGPGAPIQPGAAFTPGGAANNIDGTPAVGVAGRDGNVWKHARK